MIKTAVVTGGHAFDVLAFHSLLRSLPEVDFYLQALENLAADTERVLDQYDVLVFYNMHTATPEGRVRAVLERLRQSDQGIGCLPTRFPIPKHPVDKASHKKGTCLTKRVRQLPREGNGLPTSGQSLLRIPERH